MAKELKRLRGQRLGLRKVILAACDAFEAGTDDAAKIAAIVGLGERMERLRKVDSMIQEKLDVEEDAMAEEVEECEQFLIRAERALVFQPTRATTASQPSMRSFRFNQLQPIEYDLSPKNWTAFWGQYKVIHEDAQTPVVDKFQFLLRCLKPGTRAYKLAQSYPPFPENYTNLVEHLRRRFGKDELVIDAAVRELLNIVNSDRNSNLSELVDILGAQIRTLTALGVGSANYQLFLFPLLEKCLPQDVLELWLMQNQNQQGEDNGSLADDVSQTSETSINKVSNLMNFLERLVENKDHVDALKERTKVKETSVKNTGEVATQRTAAALHSAPVSCIFCDMVNHKALECRKVLKMPIVERRELVKSKRACFNCLQRGHQASQCRKNVSCTQCGRRHYAVICDAERDGGGPRDSPLVGKDVRAGPSGGATRAAPTTGVKTQACYSKSTGDTVFMKTLRARIKVKGAMRDVRIFLDDGSQKSYIRKKLASELGLIPVDDVYLIHGLFGGFETKRMHHHVYDLTLLHLVSNEAHSVSVIDQERLCGDIGGVTDGAIISELRQVGIELTDTAPEAEIDLILGSDMIPRLLTGRMELLPSGAVATETHLGWVIQGVGQAVARRVESCLNICAAPKVRNLWDLDILGIAPPESTSPDDSDAILHFENTTYVNDQGRFVVSLPWKGGHPPLETNRALSEARLRSTTRRLEQQGMFQAYNDVLKGWASEGIIEKVEGKVGAEHPVHYLPHHGVWKPQSRTTKLRPVFDASAANKGRASLNQCLNKGPNLIPLILPILQNFRMEQFGVTADIKQAFLMLELDEKDRDVMRFLWWEGDSIAVYRHCRVVFGVASSPFLLNCAIDKLLTDEHTPEYVQTLAKLRKGFYVDNCLASCDSEEELVRFKEQATRILGTRHFVLRDWMSNSDKIREVDTQMENVLGLKWDVAKDTLRIDHGAVEKCLEDGITKRSLLSVVNAIYDPLGMVAAVLLVPKLIIQEAWKMGLEWDEELPQEMARKVTEWCAAARELKHCTIPRWIGYKDAEELSVHIFCDASAVAYAACIFLRVGGERPAQCFVVAKARVGPVQPLTIPRMELLGACIAARLYAAIAESFPRPVKSHFWTDSSVVLCWVKKREPWKTFVGNRVTEIRALSDVEAWRWVPGALNPADVLTRGCDVAELKKREWLQGPEWLLRPPEAWPVAKRAEEDAEAMKERKKCVAANLNVAEDPFSKRLIDYFSRYVKVMRMVAWVLRFAFNAKHPGDKRSGGLTGDEMDEAERRLFRVVQNEGVDTKCHQSLRIYEDSEGLLRIQTKLFLSKEVEEFKEPILLVDHPVVRLYVFYIHQQVQHAGVETTLVRLRGRVWLVRGRQVVRAVISKCLICKKYDAQPITPVEAPLPVDRVNQVAVFQVCGVDLAGPLFLKGKEKAWVVVFTCAVYRAVHFELVTSLSTDVFLQAVRRMMARRGQVQLFWCDNGSNFRGASNALETVDWEEAKTLGATHRIRFRFIPPAAPWFGGWWEIMVKLMKRVLKKSLGKAYLGYEELSTVLCSCEQAVNSRPLTYLSEDTELQPLTPAIFLNDLRGADEVQLDLVEAKSLNRRFVYLQKVRSQLKERFRSEYLSTLVHFRQNKKPVREMQPGDVVLVGAENVKRIDWPLAVVEEVFSGKDGETRVARVRTANGELVRPIKKLYPLELETKEGVTLSGRCELDDTPRRNQDVQSETEVEVAPSLERRTRGGRVVKVPSKLDL